MSVPSGFPIILSNLKWRARVLIPRKIEMRSWNEFVKWHHLLMSNDIQRGVWSASNLHFIAIDTFTFFQMTFWKCMEFTLCAFCHYPLVQVHLSLFKSLQRVCVCIYFNRDKSKALSLKCIKHTLSCEQKWIWWFADTIEFDDIIKTS